MTVGWFRRYTIDTRQALWPPQPGSAHVSTYAISAISERSSVVPRSSPFVAKRVYGMCVTCLDVAVTVTVVAYGCWELFPIRLLRVSCSASQDPVLGQLSAQTGKVSGEL